jgi:hypothetical protein
VTPLFVALTHLRPLTLAPPQYDNLIVEEAAQIMEIEAFIPMVLQVRPK